MVPVRSVLRLSMLSRHIRRRDEGCSRRPV